MNYTNFTTDKPAVYEQSSASTFGSGRDIAYLVFSILQFGITVLTLVLVNYIIRKKDRKDEKERFEKEERDKIADIINNEYNKIVEDGIDGKLKKCKAKFEAMVMFYGDAWETRGRIKYKITGLDVLRYQLLNPNKFKGEPLNKLQKDLDAVVRLFRSLRLKLPLKGDCPINIKEELGPLITDVGEIARSFVSGRNRYTIANVLKYFGNVREEVGSIEDKEREDDDDNRKTRRMLPYVNGLSLGETSLGEFYGTPLSSLSTLYYDQDFSFDFGNWEQGETIDALKDIQSELCKKEKTIGAEVLISCADKIDVIWRRKFQQKIDIPMPDWSKEEHLRANILHAVRVFMFKVVESDIVQDEEFKKLLGKMRKIANVQDYEVQKTKSERAIYDIKRLMRGLEGSKSHLCEHQFIAKMLEGVQEQIRRAIVHLELELAIPFNVRNLPVEDLGNLQGYDAFGAGNLQGYDAFGAGNFQPII